MNLRTYALFFFTAATLALHSGCGSDEPERPSLSSLELRMEAPAEDATASCAVENGSGACPRDATGHLVLIGHDYDGAEVALDTASVTWTVDATGPTVELTSSGTTATIVAKQDWFDTGGAEGAATIVASYGGLQASLPVTVVIDASGGWDAALDIGFTYGLDLRQTGRTVEDVATGYTGSVTGDALSLSVSGIMVDARFTSRAEVRGTYSGAGRTGTLVCTRR